MFEKVSLVGHLENNMTPERLEKVQHSISETYDKIPTTGTQVRFAKWNHKPGYTGGNQRRPHYCRLAA